MTTQHLPWTEKYRPKALEDIVSHDHVVGTLQRLIASNRIPHLLFYGPAGTGKTSTILCLCNQIFNGNGSERKSNVLELNASDSRGIDTVRNEISSFASSSSLFGNSNTKKSNGHRLKVVILDEADNLTKEAQMALRRVIERFSGRCVFCLICNYSSNLMEAIQSRCTKFRFGRLDRENVLDKIHSVSEKENLKLSQEAKEAVYKLSDGDMRRVLNLMQSVQLGNGPSEDEDVINEDQVCSVAGKLSQSKVESLFQNLFKALTLKEKVRLLEREALNGVAIEDVVSECFQLVKRMQSSTKAKCFLYTELAKIEQSVGSDHRLKLQRLAAVFHLSKIVI